MQHAPRCTQNTGRSQIQDAASPADAHRGCVRSSPGTCQYRRRSIPATGRPCPQIQASCRRLSRTAELAASSLDLQHCRSHGLWSTGCRGGETGSADQGRHPTQQAPHLALPHFRLSPRVGNSHGRANRVLGQFSLGPSWTLAVCLHGGRKRRDRGT